jgi:hypothetical protein
MKHIFNVVLIFLLIAANKSYAQKNYCDVMKGGKSPIKIYATIEKGIGERKYFFEIENKTEMPIIGVVIGKGVTQDPIQSIPENQIKKVLSPDGWKGFEVFQEEGFYSTVVWQKTDKTATEVKPIKGFALIVNGDGTIKSFGKYSDGNPPTITDYSRLQFTVRFSGGKCAVGKIRKNKASISL